MVMYKLTGQTGSIKVFRWFEVTNGVGTVTLLNSSRVKRLKESIIAEFPGREFQFSVRLAK